MIFLSKNAVEKTLKPSKLIRLENELNQLKENYLHVQKITKTSSWTYYIDTDEVFWSEEIYNLLGLKSRCLLKNLEDFYRFIHPEDLEKVVEALSLAIEGNEYDIEFRIIDSKGNIKFLRERTKVIYDSNEKPNRIIGIIQDLTEFKVVEENLRAFSKDLINAHRISGLGSWRYDFKEKKFYGTNELFRIYDIEPEDMKKDFEDLMKIIHPKDRPRVIEAMKKYTMGDAISIEFRVIQKDGSYKYVLVKGEPRYDKDGQVVEIFGIVQDLTENKILEEKLMKSYNIIAQAEALANIGSWEMDIKNNQLIFSDEAMKIYGLDPEEFDNTYESFLKIVHPDDLFIFDDLIKCPRKGPFNLEFRFMKPDGSVGYIYQSIEFLFNEEREPILVYGTIQDITEIKELENELIEKQREKARLEKRFETLIRESNDVFEILDKDGTIIYISDAVERVTGYKVEEKLGRKPWDFYEDEEKEKVKKAIEMALSKPNKRIIGDFIIRRKDGEKVHIEANIQNLLDNPNIEGLVMNYRDITKRIEAERQIAYTATHDKLTGLPNNIHFVKKLRLQCEYAKKFKKPFALMMLDISGIKNVNYYLGYEAGDQLIIGIVERLKDYLGEETFISRYYDDLFAIIIQGMRHLGDYETIGKGIIKQFKKPFKIENYEFDLNVNLGICIYPKDAEDSDSLRKNAKLALMRAKREGKNLYRFYASDLDIKSYMEFVLKSDLHKVIKEKQLIINYQPMVSLKDNNILAAEALLRWKHPEWGIIKPDDFIYLAEETGLIIDIGKWTLREVCKNYKEWLEEGLAPIKVAVNFSPAQFYEENFVENILEIINEYELDPKFLIIEITEYTLLKDIDTIVKNIKELQAKGIQVAIDDFGIGYSSLVYLSNLNIDIIKIDKSFIRKLASEEDNRAIVKFIVNLAKDLKIKLVAEGIESPDQLMYLKNINCYTGQGFIFSQPLPVEDFKKVLARGKIKTVVFRDLTNKPFVERRKFFRVKFTQLLEGDLTILEIRGRKINVGNTKILIKNMGPGGLCFISNIKFPVVKDIILQFTTELMGNEIKVHGHPVWTKEMDNELYEYGIQLHEYGVEFTIDENERMELIRELNMAQIKMRKNELFVDGRFISGTHVQYFVDLIKNRNNGNND